MLMTINITLLIQIANFFIAYWILERYFFRYAIRVITKRDGDVLNLRAAIIEEKTQSDVLREHAKEQWKRYQRMLQHEVPSLIPPRLKLHGEDYVSKFTSKQDEQKLTQDLTRTLVARLIQ